MRILLLCLAILAAGPAAAAPAGTMTLTDPVPLRPAAPAAAPAKPAFASREAVLAWMNKYRGAPELKRVPDVVKALSRLQAFKDPENAGVYIGFMAGVIGANPARAEQIALQMLPLPVEDQWALVRAIAYSGLADWKGLLRRIEPRIPARGPMIARYVADEMPTLDAPRVKREPTTVDKLKDFFGSKRKPASGPKALEPSPELVDLLWGQFFATGGYGALVRLVGLLPLAADSEDADKLAVGSTAKFTLASNAARDADLLAKLRTIAKKPSKEAGPVLEDVIKAAETVDAGRIRKEQMAAIEDLKRKGPNSRRNISKWGQLGEAGVALGCVAAAVAGAVALGVPCVVGGAMTSATVRYLSNP